MWRNKLFFGFMCLAIFFVAIPTAKAEVVEVIFSDDFETGLGNWQVSNGVWELCLRAEPDPDLGLFYVETKCGENYPNHTDSRLFTNIDLTRVEVTGDQEIHLRFWQWFYYGDDHGLIQISEDDGSTWVDLGSTYHYSIGWSPRSIDITAHVGKNIRIAFYHIADDRYTYPGWAIDNFAVIKIEPDPPPYTFEEGWGDWSADRGVWDIGAPTAGPDGSYEGEQCAGTVLGNNYPNHTDSRFISPSFWVDDTSGNENEEVHLRFWQWFYYGDDYGKMQISVYDESTGWSEWEDIPTHTSIWHYCVGWGPSDVDITAYEDKKVRIAFYHIADDRYTYPGWFIDDIQMITKVPEPTWDFECGWDDWAPTRGIWQVGTPEYEYGPANCYSGTGCVGTSINGTYPNHTDSCLVSASTSLPELNGFEKIVLNFRHWYYYGDDYGKVRIQVYDEETDQWSWVDANSTVVGDSGGWTKHPDIDLSPYAGKKIRLGFCHYADDRYTYAGWYIDHIRITGFPHFCECDLNQDGMCDMQDWLLFGEDWGRTDCGTPPGSGCWPNDCECDLNHDGRCDMSDWLRFGEDWGLTDCLICEYIQER